MDVAVLIPCYNEASTVGKVVASIYPKHAFMSMITIQLMKQLP